RSEFFDFHDLLEQSASSARKAAGEKPDLEISFHFKAAEHSGLGDPSRLRQVFVNLIKNAIKFTPEGGSVRLQTENVDGDRIQVSVVDTGIGISSDQLALIFDAFQQGGEEITRSYGGLGLGLAICKGLVE